MLVTDTFVYLHQPKTGGTFVAEVIGAIHEARGNPMHVVTVEPGNDPGLVPVPARGAVRLLLSGRNQHGSRRDIPESFRNRSVVATIRNPYDRYISQFEFAWWRVVPEMFGPVEQTRHTCPDYPELTFDQFVHLTNTVSVRRAGDGTGSAPGFHTQQFIEYFFREPDQAWACLGDAVALRSMWDEEMRGLHFLDQSRLNDDLAAFLQHGYADQEVAFIRSAGRIRPAPTHTDGTGWTRQYSNRLGGYVGLRHDMPDAAEVWAQYYTPELKAFVRCREQLLFEQFPQFDL